MSLFEIVANTTAGFGQGMSNAKRRMENKKAEVSKIFMDWYAQNPTATESQIKAKIRTLTEGTPYLEASLPRDDELGGYVDRANTVRSRESETHEANLASTRANTALTQANIGLTGAQTEDIFHSNRLENAKFMQGIEQLLPNASPEKKQMLIELGLGSELGSEEALGELWGQWDRQYQNSLATQESANLTRNTENIQKLQGYANQIMRQLGDPSEWSEIQHDAAWNMLREQIPGVDIERLGVNLNSLFTTRKYRDMVDNSLDNATDTMSNLRSFGRELTSKQARDAFDGNKDIGDRAYAAVLWQS